MAKFTPGPWIIDEHLDIRNKRSHVIAQVSHMPGKIGGKDVFNPKSMANARLIAAAPEMYELLKEELIPTSDYGGILSFSRENKVKELLARIDGEEEDE